MIINKIQSNNTTFGYNATLNAQLMKDFGNAKKNKAYYGYLKNLCTITNNMELNLRDAEKKGKTKLMEKLTTAFIPLKVMISDVLDELMPKYHYGEKEFETYTEEIEKRNLQNTPHWLNELVTYMKSTPETLLGQNFTSNQNAGMVPEQLENADNEATLVNVLKQLFPGAQIVTTRKYIPENAGIEHGMAEEGPMHEAENAQQSLNEILELGKSKVIEYKPTGNALKGFSSLGGMKQLKAELTDKIVDYLKNPEQAQIDAKDYGTALPKGLILYGPPGCGKTTVVKHLSTEAGVPLLKLETGNLKTSYWHETSKNIDAAFEYAYSVAKPDKPVLMLVDDADSFFISRSDHSEQFESEEMTTFLNKIQEAPEKNVMVVLTTNRYDIMDAAVRRRFDTQIYVGLPDEEARASLLKLFLSKNAKSTALANNEEAVKRLAKKLEGFPISAIEDMSKEACDIARRDAKIARNNGSNLRRDVIEADFEKVLSKPETQNKKIKEDNYKTNATRTSVGFNK